MQGSRSQGEVNGRKTTTTKKVAELHKKMMEGEGFTMMQ